jgi:hypothetical protein
MENDMTTADFVSTDGRILEVWTVNGDRLTIPMRSAADAEYAAVTIAAALSTWNGE